MNKQAMMDEFRKGATAHATKAVKEGGLGIEDDEDAERLVDMVEQEADKWAKQVALATGGEIDKEASVGVDNDALNGFILKMAEHAIEEAGGPEEIQKSAQGAQFNRALRALAAQGGEGLSAPSFLHRLSRGGQRAARSAKGGLDDVVEQARRGLGNPSPASAHEWGGAFGPPATAVTRGAALAGRHPLAAGAAGGGALATLGALVATMGGEDPEGMSEDELVAKGQEAAEQLEGMDLGTRGLGAAGGGAAGYGLAGLPGAAVGGGLGAMSPEIIDMIQGAVGGEA